VRARNERTRAAAPVEWVPPSDKKEYTDELAPSRLDHVEPDIAVTDRKIEDMVYGLYGMTDEERKIVEERPGGG